MRLIKELEASPQSIVESRKQDVAPHPRVFLLKSVDLLDYKGVGFFRNDKEFVVA